MSQAATTRSARIQQLRDIIIEVLEIEPEELTDTNDFVEDYDADSLMAMVIIAKVDQEMGVQLPDECVPKMVNVNAVLRLVDQYAGHPAAAPVIE
jgi:acyl carrier protein